MIFIREAKSWETTVYVNTKYVLAAYGRMTIIAAIIAGKRPLKAWPRSLATAGMMDVNDVSRTTKKGFATLARSFFNCATECRLDFYFA